MAIAIVSLVLVGYLLIIYEHITYINKATIAMFTGVVCWILLACEGGLSVSKVFSGYSVEMCAIVLYLLATINIASVLNANGCFDFMVDIIRRQESKWVLWSLTGFTWLLSTNLDNLTTTVIMLMIMHKVVENPKWRMWLGACIIIAANCGGAVTVIGDITSLTVWSKGLVTPSNFFMTLLVPSLISTVIPVALVSRALPERLELVRPTIRYRGDSQLHSKWVRTIMLVVGLGGLWFIPTFHAITDLPAFLGALCVLGVLWVLHELFNHKRIKSEQPVEMDNTRRFEFATLQSVMYFVGIFMAVSALIEVGVMHNISSWCDEWIHNIYFMSLAMGAISTFLDNIALVLTGINIYPLITDISEMSASLSPTYAESFLQNGQYWHLIIFSGSIAGCLLPIGNVSGYMLMKSEDVDISWYAKHVLPKVLVGWLAGLGAYFLVDLWLR